MIVTVEKIVNDPSNLEYVPLKIVDFEGKVYYTPFL